MDLVTFDKLVCLEVNLTYIQFVMFYGYIYVLRFIVCYQSYMILNNS